jgi:redox-sensitive bicupin YhaK (pirin superfamily)
MELDIIRSSESGYFDHGWLQTSHVFSFADYYNPLRMNFGTLRVLNDDYVSPYKGFGMHPHKNMEIITIPLKGSLEHTDSTGVKGVIQPNEVQVMSAGTGIMHSEQNPAAIPVNLLQIWIFPKEDNIKPRYDQKYFESDAYSDNYQLLVSPDGRNGSLMIHQDAYISRRFASNTESFVYKIHKEGNGLFLYVIEGSSVIEDKEIFSRDSALITNINVDFEISPSTNSFLLFIEVPLVD